MGRVTQKGALRSDSKSSIGASPTRGIELNNENQLTLHQIEIKLESNRNRKMPPIWIHESIGIPRGLKGSRQMSGGMGPYIHISVPHGSVWTDMIGCWQEQDPNGMVPPPVLSFSWVSQALTYRTASHRTTPQHTTEGGALAPHNHSTPQGGRGGQPWG